MSDTVTKGVRINIDPKYLEHQSDPTLNHWMYLYNVTITNEGEHTVQLLSRHWIITNNKGEEEHVRGPGVVGQQPVLRTGESFRYTSGCPMDTAFGTMHGTYQMIVEGGEKFDAEIAPFTLAEPYALN
ncbi:MAG: ApaG protein [Myxococcota bacterium]|jgi:ApaG protein